MVYVCEHSSASQEGKWDIHTAGPHREVGCQLCLSTDGF